VYDFPGTGPLLSGAACGQFGQVKVLVNPAQLEDLSVNHNKNVLGRDTDFFTREGVGVVNAPVTPDAVYIGRTGSNQGVSVIDLNGFGASTATRRTTPRIQSSRATRTTQQPQRARPGRDPLAALVPG
jgi:hypothetical protein